MAKIGIVLGSTRPHGLITQIGEWALTHLQKCGTDTYELLNIKDFDLPFFDEPQSPKASSDYQHAHTQRWSAAVAQYAAFIFIFPEYNGGIPAVLKNALDYLYVEWKDKPAAYIAYGFSGGSRAAAAFELIAPNLGMQLTGNNTSLQLSADLYNDQGQLADPESAFAKETASLEKLAAALTSAL